MRIQLNGGCTYKEDSHYEYNDLYKRFRKVFKIILDGDDPHKYSNDPNKWYVSVKDIEGRINDIIESDSSSLHYLIGQTGIGKSTVLRKCTNGIRNPIDGGGVLVIPFNFDNRNIPITGVEDSLASSWISNADFIKEKYKIQYSQKEFIEFIKSHASDVLYNGTVDINSSDEEKLATLQKNSPYSHNIELFKYFFYKSGFDKLLIVVDDIESVDHDIQVNLIEIFYRAYNCVRNVGDNAKVVNTIISIRPNTQKLTRNSESIKSHYFSIPVKITKPVSLVEIFKKRFNEVLSRSDYSHIKDTKEWDRTLEVLLHLCDSISGRYGNRFIALFNYNIRRTLAEFNLIIVNRKWFQRDRIPNPSFRIDELDYAISEAAVYRVLGMKNSNFYPVESTCLPNLLYNKPEPTHDLVLVYMIKYFLKKNSGNKDLDATINKDSLVTDFVKLFKQNNMEEVVLDCLEFGCNSKLFEESTNASSKKVIFLTPRAKELYKMIGEKNLSLQLFRDDVFQDYSKENRRRSLTINLRGRVLFEEMLHMSYEIFDWEKNIIETFILNGNSGLAINSFGDTLFSEHLLEGTSNSISAYFQDDSNDIQIINNMLFSLGDRVKDLSSKYKHSNA